MQSPGFTAVEPSRPPSFDWLGFLAMSALPFIALYQGVGSALGVLVTFDTVTEALIGILALTACAILRVPRLIVALSNAAVSRAALYLAFYLLVVFVSTLLVFVDPIERDPSRMTLQFLSTVPPVMLFFVLVASPGPAAAIRSLRASLLVWAIAAVLTPLTAFTPLPIGEVQGTYVGSAGLRSFGVLGDAGTFVISFLVVATFATRRMIWFLLSMFALVLSGSRMALVVAGVGIALVLVLGDPKAAIQRPGAKALRAMGAIGLMLVLLLIVQFVFSAVSEQLGVLNAIERLQETNISGSDRFFSARQGLEWFQLSPFYGHGFNSYYYFSLRGSIFGANQANALNQVVQTLMDGGLLALLFLMLFFLQVLWPKKGHQLIDRRSDPFAIKAWLLAFVVVNQTAVYILPAFSLTALVFGLAGVSLYLEVSAKPSRTGVPSQPRPAAAPVC